MLLGLVGHEAVADIREPSMAEFGMRLEVAQGKGHGEGGEKKKGGQELAEGCHYIGAWILSACRWEGRGRGGGDE